VNNGQSLKPEIKKILKIILTVIACLAVIYLGISSYGAKKAMTIPRLPMVYDGSVLGVPYEEVSFSSRDGFSLKGWLLSGSNNQVIVFIHGGFQNRLDEIVDTKRLAPALAARGYTVLLYDQRGRGESEGKGRTLSNIDEDIGGAVDFLVSRGFRPGDINIIGFCAGAAQSAIYARHHEVGSLIMDGCFIDNATMVSRQAQSINLPAWLARVFVPGGTLMTRLMYGFHRIDPIDVVPDLTCPVLFFHEELDPFTTMEETRQLFYASTNPLNEWWEISGAEHSKGYRTDPQGYVDRIDGFLTKLR
jgi:pimeloyl-ACP methyl ester carboxylesterase